MIATLRSRAAALYDRAREPDIDGAELDRRIAEYMAVQHVVGELTAVRLKAELAARDADLAMR